MKYEDVDDRYVVSSDGDVYETNVAMTGSW